MNIYRVIGCMTGTSCDGLDLAYIETDGVDILNIGPAQTIPFEPDYKNTLRNRVVAKQATCENDKILEKTIAAFHGVHIKAFIQKNCLKVDAIGFHGQTVWHDPANQFTVQLGDCQQLANLLGLKVVGEFRQNDIKRGGQAAPLVPIYHQALAANLEKPLGFLNIGGVANISFIGQSQELIAGDVGPGNALIDDWVAKHTGIAQDTDGRHAAKGKVDLELLDQWLNDDFFKKPFPKSLDRMHFHNVLEGCRYLSLEDGAATLTQFTVESILRSLEKIPKIAQLIVCGGGCHNPVIMKGLKNTFEKVIGAASLGFDPDAIEAQLMAYLAARFFEGLPSSFKGTTGVDEPTIAGKLFQPHSQ